VSLETLEETDTA